MLLVLLSSVLGSEVNNRLKVLVLCDGILREILVTIADILSEFIKFHQNRPNKKKKKKKQKKKKRKKEKKYTPEQIQ